MRSFYRFSLCIAATLMLSISERGQAFSLGVRAGAGMELFKVSAIKLFRNDENTQITADDEFIDRAPIHFGADLVITPLNFGNLGISVLLGFRGTSAKVDGQFNDERQFSYLPIGASVDYSMGSLRFSGYTLYDLSLGPKFIVSSGSTGTSANLEVKGLSRLRFGATGEFFILKNLSIFAGGDLVTGSFENGPGQISVKDEAGGLLDVTVSASQNKISGFSFGGGVAYTYALSESKDSTRTKASKKQGKKQGKKPRKKTSKKKKAK